jgi:acetylglutamate synthase
MTKKQNPAQGQEQTQTIKELGNAITTMDCLSSIGFSEIASIAKLALISLETPEGYRHISDIAFALESIRSKAQDMENLINCEAESTGFNHIDDAWHRRISAEATFRNAEGVQA